MIKKVFRYLFRILSVLLICVLIYFVYITIWIKNFNADQSKAVENLDFGFHQTSQIIRDPNGHFGVIATINRQHKDTLLLDTQASTSLAKQEVLDTYDAEYWRRKPMPTFNFYKQMYFSKLYKVREISIGDCKLNGVTFTSVQKDNGMYNALYRTVLGRTVLEKLGWKFDMDNDEMTMFALNNEKLLEHETEGFTFVKSGINNLPLYSKQTDSLDLMLDLGSNYDIVIDKTVYEKLRQIQAPKVYANFRREGLTDTIAEFRGITMHCNGVTISDCTLSYIPTINKNIAGNIFAGKMNFILAGKNLYIKQCTDSLQPIQDGLPPLGLRINVRDSDVCVTALEIGGTAEKSGVMLGDKIIAVNHWKVNTDIMSVSSGKLEKYIQQAERLTLEVERNGARVTLGLCPAGCNDTSAGTDKLKLK